MEERAKNGLSIVIAPEGTRLDTTEVGPFKKGPFRIAMAAGIPIVPIVIRNAEIVASRNSTTINPGTVDIAVFPPIPVDDWTLDTLPDRIAEVRQLYLDTLKDWPVDELPEVNLYAEEKAAKKAKAQLAKASAKETPAKKAPAKKAAAKKETPAKKAPAKKAPAKKAPAKKATAKKAPANKAPAKKVPESAAAKAATRATDTELSAPKPVGEASNPTEIAPEPIAHDGDAQQLGAGRSDAAESSSSRPKGRP